MKKILAGGTGIAASLVMVFGSGSAGAINELVGLTYERAAETVSGAIKIASRQGSYLPTAQCVVTGSRKLLSLDSSGNSGSYTYLVDLNCNDTSALNGHPGNSVATEAGKKALEAREMAKTLSEDYAKANASAKTPACFVAENNTNYCVKVCTESKACSAELVEALGM